MNEPALITSSERILGYTFEEYAGIVRRFHGSDAPGVLIGGFMVSLALRKIPAGTLYDVICETKTCLPDAIQLLTPCTVGNGWMKIFDFGRYALTLYDKTRGDHDGVRVFMNPLKILNWPEIHAWFFKLKSSKEQHRERLIQEIGEAGDSILDYQPVKVRPQVTIKKHKGEITVCPKCREAYPASDGEICQVCRTNPLYL